MCEENYETFLNVYRTVLQVLFIYRPIMMSDMKVQAV